MSDGGVFPFPFIFGEPPSEEEMLERKRQMELSQMETSEFRHNSFKWIYGLDEDQLTALRSIVIAASETKEFAMHMAGQCTALLHIRHNIC